MNIKPFLGSLLVMLLVGAGGNVIAQDQTWVRFEHTQEGYEGIAEIDPRLVSDFEVFEEVKSRLQNQLFSAPGYNEGNVERYNVRSEIIWMNTKIISILEAEYLYQDGAHGETIYTSRIWNRDTDREVAVEDLFTAEGLEVAFENIQAEALLRAQKIVIYPRNSISRSSLERTLQEPGNWPRGGRVLLSPSTESNASGGLIFWFSHYGETPYTVVVPQYVFAEYLKPDYSDVFSGEPFPVDGWLRTYICDSAALAGCDQTQ